MTDGLRINFAEVEEKSFELIPGGKYPTMVAAYDVTPVASPGKDAPSNPMKVEWQFTIQPSGNADMDKFAGRNVWTNTTLYGGGLGRLKNLLKCLGFNVEGELDLGNILPQTINKTVMSAIRVRPAQGEYQAKNDISGWSPMGDGVTAMAQGSKSLLPG
jgi:hypothetical protein